MLFAVGEKFTPVTRVTVGAVAESVEGFCDFFPLVAEINLKFIKAKRQVASLQGRHAIASGYLLAHDIELGGLVGRTSAHVFFGSHAETADRELR